EGAVALPLEAVRANEKDVGAGRPGIGRRGTPEVFRDRPFRVAPVSERERGLREPELGLRAELPGRPPRHERAIGLPRELRPALRRRGETHERVVPVRALGSIAEQAPDPRLRLIEVATLDRAADER